MDHPLDIFQKVLPAEQWDYLMVMAEQAHTNHIAMTEGMPEPIEVSGLGRPYPDAHRINQVSRSNSPYHVVTQ